jgi:hypothetical protein
MVGHNASHDFYLGWDDEGNGWRGTYGEEGWDEERGCPDSAFMFCKYSEDNPPTYLGHY